jgi:hypothetical protein
MIIRTNNRVGLIAGVWMALMLVAGPAFAHCDAMDGPVVTDAQAALQAGDVAGVLKWVAQENEPEVRQVFQKTLVVRTKGPEARELADMYFFETLVRLHRAGEGEPYTGIKPAGTPVPAPVARADQALEHDNVDALAGRIAAAVETGIRDRFASAAEARKHRNDSVEAGRQYVAAYVEFVHYVQAIHDMIAGHGAHHGHQSASPAGQRPDPAAGAAANHGH